MTMRSQLATRLLNLKQSSTKNRSQRQISELTKLYSKMCIFSCFVFKSDEYSVAYENLQSNTDAYKLVAYKKKRV